MKVLLILITMAVIITVQFFTVLELRYDLSCIKESFELCQQHEILTADFRSSTDNSDYSYLTSGKSDNGSKN